MTGASRSASTSSRGARTSRWIQSAWAEQIGVAARQRHGDAIGHLEAAVPTHRVHGVDDVVDAAFELELRVDRGVEGDADAVVLGDRPALDGDALAADHLVGRE